MTRFILFSYIDVFLLYTKVTYYGDCSQGQQQLDKGTLDDYRQLLDQGERVGSDLSLRALSESLE